VSKIGYRDHDYEIVGDYRFGIVVDGFGIVVDGDDFDYGFGNDYRLNRLNRLNWLNFLNSLNRLNSVNFLNRLNSLEFLQDFSNFSNFPNSLKSKTLIKLDQY
jgi:hypothetical protein